MFSAEGNPTPQFDTYFFPLLGGAALLVMWPKNPDDKVGFPAERAKAAVEAWANWEAPAVDSFIVPGLAAPSASPGDVVEFSGG